MDRKKHTSVQRRIVFVTRGGESDRLINELVAMVRVLGSNEAFQILRQYLNAQIKSFSKKYRIPGCDGDEVEQECLYALRYKAIADFNAERGNFRSFAILCIKRHLFSILKGNKQQKRRVLNESISLDEDRSNGDDLSLANLVVDKGPSVEELLGKREENQQQQDRLMEKLSPLEQDVFRFYVLGYSYDEIVDELNKNDDGYEYNRKAVDNALVRLRIKSRG